MSKRSYPWEEGDYQRQYKMHVNDRMSGDGSQMMDIYSARRAASLPPTVDSPGTSRQPSDPCGTDGDMDIDDDYETYEQLGPLEAGANRGPNRRSNPGNAGGEDLDMKLLPDLIPRPSTSSSGLRLVDVESSPESPDEDGNGNAFWLRIPPSSPCSANRYHERIMEAYPESPSRHVAWPRMSRRRSRLDTLRNTERRDPSPMPPRNLITNFLRPSRQSNPTCPYSPLTNEETYTKYYKGDCDNGHYSFLEQLNTIKENPSANLPESDKDNIKDVNDNKEMEY